MKLHLLIDGLDHQIDSSDPELLARWIMEIFGRIEQITPATYIQVQAMPSFLPDGNGSWRPDWAADSRVLGITQPAATPRQLLESLANQLDMLEQLHANDR